MTWWKYWYGLLVAGLFVAVILFRYDLVATSGEAIAAARLDRWTGEVCLFHWRNEPDCN